MSDLSIEILKQIRDDLGAFRADVGEFRDEFRTFRASAVQRFGSVEQRLGRVEQGLVDLAGFMREMVLDFARYERFHRRGVDRLDDAVDDLRLRVTRLETANDPKSD